MIKELERLLSNSYTPNDNLCFSAIVKCKDTKTFAGVVVKNDIFRNTIYAEEAAIANAVSHGYKKGDLDSIHIMVSTNNLNDLKNINKNMILEFFEVDKNVYLYNLNREVKVIKVGNLINNIY